MINSTYYRSPLGEMLLASKNNKLIGAWFEGQKYYLANINENIIEKEDEILIKTVNWLDDYFKGNKPSINGLDLAPEGSDFRLKVWEILREIPYGETITYGEIAKRISKEGKMSAQAVGGAVAHNPISIIIPCHRVVGANGKLTGYAGGIDRKRFLLEHEKKR
ncbi:methylated-DNA--[protein]-cysteine S-methyltransferase [Methanobrevibacter millerae]